MQAILFKTAVVIIGAVLCWSALRFLKREQSLENDGKFITFVVVLALGLRVAIYVAIYVIAHKEVTSDVPAYYVPAGRAVLSGLIPYRDLYTSYAPLFSYVAAGLLWLYDSPKVFAIFDIVSDIVALVLWYLAACQIGSQKAARVAAVMYACAGAIVVQALLGTNQHWIALANAASLYFTARNRTILSGMVQGFALATVKVLGILSWPVFWLASREQRKWLCAAVVVSGAVYLYFVALHADVLLPIKIEGKLSSAGNLPYVLQPLLAALGVSARHIDIGTALILVLAVLWLIRMRGELRTEQQSSFAIAAIVFCQAIFMLVSKKSFPAYFAFVAFPAWLVIAERIGSGTWSVTFYSVFNLLLALESSLWFWLGGDGKPLSDWATETSSRTIAIFCATDFLLISAYLYLVYLSATWILTLSKRGLHRTSVDDPHFQLDMPVASSISTESTR